MIKTCPGFERYGIDDRGNIVSSCRGDWSILRPSKGVLSLRGERTITCKVAKFRYCVENQIDPSKISCIGAIITNDGKIMTKSDFTSLRNSVRPKARADRPIGDKINKIQRHIEFCQASIEWLKGRPEKVITICNAERENICCLLYCNKSLARDIVMEAELQLFSALNKGTVIDPYNWLVKRSRGILLEIKKRYKRYSDDNLAQYSTQQ